MRFSPSVRLMSVTLGALIIGRNASAQCRPPASSHEARLLAFYEVPAAFSLGAAPRQLRRGAVEVGVEALPVPSPNAALTHPEYCYQYTTNNTKLAPVFGRPRIMVGLPGALMLEASYVPPIAVSDARASVGSVGISRLQTLPFLGRHLSLLLRGSGTFGRVSGPITCPRGSLQTIDPGAPCYGNLPSRDYFDPNSLGIETALGAGAGRVVAYVGTGIAWERPHFRAGFIDANGIADRTTVDVALVRNTAFGGASFRVNDGLEVSSQLYAVPGDATTIRIGFSYRVR
jgi:hypothetical protein